MTEETRDWEEKIQDRDYWGSVVMAIKTYRFVKDTWGRWIKTKSKYIIRYMYVVRFLTIEEHKLKSFYKKLYPVTTKSNMILY